MQFFLKCTPIYCILSLHLHRFPMATQHNLFTSVVLMSLTNSTSECVIIPLSNVDFISAPPMITERDRGRAAEC